MEDGFADQPQEAVNAGPELADVAQRLGAVIKKVDAVNAVAEARIKPPVMMAGINGAKISASTLMTFCNAFWFCLAALLTASFETPSMPETQ